MGCNNGDKAYEHFFFPVDRFSKDEAIGQFKPVKKKLKKTTLCIHILHMNMMEKLFIQ